MNVLNHNFVINILTEIVFVSNKNRLIVIKFFSAATWFNINNQVGILKNMELVEKTVQSYY